MKAPDGAHLAENAAENEHKLYESRNSGRSSQLRFSSLFWSHFSYQWNLKQQKKINGI